MSVTIETIAKWQPPSVLHLLPFSKNNAGTIVNNSNNNSMVTSQFNQQASYAQDANVNGKGLPELPSNTRGREKPRSKSAVVMEDRVQLHKQEQQHRLFRASSERISRSPKKPSGSRSFIERARSEYVTKSERKLTQEVVTFAIKDINEQILGQSGKIENDSADIDRNPTTENGRYKIKPLLKPVTKLHEGRWPQNNARFWRSSTISPGERDLQKHKTSLDAQISALKRSKLVKLNVKDLPRSQTPIGENDPDKLNMKQVIAFLQSSGDVRDAHDDGINEKRRIKSSNSVTKNKSDSSKKGDKMNENNKDNSAVLLIAAKSRRKDETSDNNNTSGGINKAETTQSNQSNKPDPHSEDSISKTDNNNNLDPVIKPRPNSYTGEIPSKPTEDDDGKHHQSQTDNSQRSPRPKSLHFLRDNTEFRIPARIRQIRESTADNRPFRLHRFLTLVSNNPEDEILSKRKVNGRENSNNSRFTSSSSVHNNSKNVRSSPNFSKTRDEEKQSKTYADSNGFFLTQTQHSSSSRNDNEKKRERRRRSKHSSSPNQLKTETGESNGNEKIICLPTMPVDFDSDDDSNFISLPTVPSKSTRKDLVLSAHGHAILTKHFPQVETFKRATIRPHSEKITLKRRLEIFGEFKERPSTVKAKDLVEWGGVKHPERIFLIDRNDADPKSSENSNSDAKPLDVARGNGELPNNGLKDLDQVDSPKNSENSPHREKLPNSPTKSKNSDDVAIVSPPDNHSMDAASDNSKEAVVGKNVCKNSSNGAKPKPESVSPSLSDPVRLTLRKERNLTREKTYMVDMESNGNDVYFGQRKYAFKDKVV